MPKSTLQMFHEAETASPLLAVVKNYQQENRRETPLIAHMFHYHEKNPDFSLHIQLLQEADKIINQFQPQDKYMAQLGILLIFRDLLMDPNRQNQVFSYLVEKLDVDHQINRVLKKISKDLVFDLTDPKFLEISKTATRLGQEIINLEQMKQALPKSFLQDIRETMVAEDEETKRLLKTIRVSKS